MRPEALGTARLEAPASIPADSFVSLAVVYAAGSLGFDDGGRLMVAFRYPADFQPPQFHDPSAPNYGSVSAGADAELTAVYDATGGFRPFSKAVVVRVTGGALAPGDEIRLVLGDTRFGSPGWRVQTFAERRSLLLVAADPVRTGTWEVLPERLWVEVTNGPAARVVAILPTEALCGEAVTLFLRVEDRWGNTARDFAGDVELEALGPAVGLPRRVSLGPENGGCLEVPGIRATERGLLQIRARVAGLAEAVSNPCLVRAPEEAGPWRPFWGDLHGQSGETIGVGTVEEYFAFARGSAHLDFASHQGNCFQVDDEKWARIRQAAREADCPGRFVAFPGYEWSANTPLGGDHNVVFLDESQPILRAHGWLAGTVPRDAGVHSADALYAALDPERAMVSHHVGGRPGNLDFFAGPPLEPFIEVHSCWGTFEWFWRDALERGLEVGFVCGSDDHKGRPGAAHPGRDGFGCYGGLVCALAERLDRPSLWEALRSRRVYGTTGARIGIRFDLAGHPMGSVVQIEAAQASPARRHRPRFEVEVVGTAALECVELWRAPLRPPEEAGNPRWRGRVGPPVGLAPAGLVERFVPWGPAAEPDDVLRVAWGGSRKRGRRRAALWDGRLELSAARILRAEPYGFVPPLTGIEEVAEHAVRWRSTTTGGRHGVLLHLDRWEGEARFDTAAHQTRWLLEEIGREGHREEVGGVDLHVEAVRLPAHPQTSHVRRVMQDSSGALGAFAYTLRVAQVDGHRAWTSPIFVRPSRAPS